MRFGLSMHALHRSASSHSQTMQQAGAETILVQNRPSLGPAQNQFGFLALGARLLELSGRQRQHQRAERTRMLRADGHAAHTGDAGLFVGQRRIIPRDSAHRAQRGALAAAPCTACSPWDAWARRQTAGTALWQADRAAASPHRRASAQSLCQSLSIAARPHHPACRPAMEGTMLCWAMARTAATGKNPAATATSRSSQSVSSS